MNSKLIYILSFILILFSEFAVSSDNNDGNELLRQCSPVLKDTGDIKDSEFFGLGFCLGMMNGITNFIGINQAEGGKSSICLPEKGITNGQAARIVVKYLNDNPQNLHYLNTLLIYIALEEAFPCSK